MRGRPQNSGKAADGTFFVLPVQRQEISLERNASAFRNSRTRHQIGSG